MFNPPATPLLTPHPPAASPPEPRGGAVPAPLCRLPRLGRSRGRSDRQEYSQVKAPRLRGAERLAQSSEAELMARILYGRELAIPLDPQALAPSDEEVAALSAYLRRLPTIPWAEIRQGQEIYDSLCVYCHGNLRPRGWDHGAATSRTPARPQLARLAESGQRRGNAPRHRRRQRSDAGHGRDHEREGCTGRRVVCAPAVPSL